MPDTERTLSRALKERALVVGDRPALFLYDAAGQQEMVRRPALEERAMAWAQAVMGDAGRESPRRVAIMLPHGVHLYAALLGAAYANAVPSIFAQPSPKISDEEFRHSTRALLTNVKPDILLVDAAWRAPLEALCKETALSARIISPTDVSHAGSAEVLPPGDAPSVALVQYSSGTTGLKKGVPLTHRALLWQLEEYGRAIAVRPDDVVASWLPLYHDMGLIAACLLPLFYGIPIAALSPFDWVKRPRSLFEAVTEHKATLCWMPNFAFNFMATNVPSDGMAGIDLSSLRAIVNCGEPIRSASHRSFFDRFSRYGLKESVFAASYAMAETTFAVTSGGFDRRLPEDLVDRHALAAGQAKKVGAAHPNRVSLVSSGVALPDTRIAIVDDHGHPLPDRMVGLIVVSSPSLFAGYEDGAQSGSAHHTGDTGYLAGRELFVTGRAKDIIISAGRNLYPHDLEALVESVPGVTAGRTVAFGVEDSALGTERIVVLAESQTGDSEARDRIATAIRTALHGADISAHDVRLVPSRWLRKSTSGKLSRQANRDRYLRMMNDRAFVSSAPDAAVLDTWTSLALSAIEQGLPDVQLRLGRPIGPEDRLVTTGLIDSLALVTLVLSLERATGVTIPATSLDVGHFETARLAGRLIQHLSTGAADHERSQEANNIIQVDDRDKAAQRFLSVSDAVDMLVLGSSKAKHMHPAVARAKGFSAFNFWLMNARAEDWYCALRFALAHGQRKLKTVVLCIDIEAFSNVADIDVRMAHSRHLAGFLDADERERLPPAPVDQTAGRFETVSTQFKLGETESWMLSGQWEPVTERFAATPVGPRPSMTIVDPHDRDAAYTLRMNGFSHLCERRWAYFSRLRSLCADHDIHLICCISPVHPALDAFLSDTTGYTERLEELLSRLRALVSTDFAIVDTRVPAAFGGLECDFPNAAHPGLVNSDRLLSFLLSNYSSGDASCASQECAAIA